MGILLDQNTRAIVQGITGHIGSIQAKWMLGYGTNIVAGVTPGKGGETIHGIPVCDDVLETVEKYGANATVLFVSAPYAKDAVLEAISAGIRLIVCVPEHIPVADAIIMRAKALSAGVCLLGPTTPGVITPGVGKLGIMPANMFKPGNIGVISRSGTLSYEVAGYLNEAGLGQSTALGIGGDPVIGTDITTILEEFEKDEQTEAVVIVGEIGGSAEEESADFIAKMKKPVVAYIAGRSAPPDKQMGHAGAIIQGDSGNADSKIQALTEAGCLIASRMSEIAQKVQQSLFK